MKKVVLIILLAIVLSVPSSTNSSLDELRVVDSWTVGSYDIMLLDDSYYIAFSKGMVSEKKKTAYRALKSLKNEYIRKTDPTEEIRSISENN